jgi:hypothetical protein
VTELEDVIQRAVQVRALLDATPSQPAPEEAPPAPVESAKPAQSGAPR